MFIHLFRPLNSLILPYHHPPANPPFIPADSHSTDTPRNSSLIPFIERFIVRCEKKKMIFIVRMIVNVRTLWLSLIQLRLRCFVATFSAVYNRRISNLHDPSGATRYVFNFFSFFLFFSREGKSDTSGRNRKRGSKSGTNETIGIRRPRHWK